MTLAGTVTLYNAEVLASLFVIYALTGNFPCYCAATHSIDLQTMLRSFGSPNQSLLGICTAQMGRYYGLRTAGNSALTDAMLPDFQGGFEKASSAILSCLAGTNGIGAQGIVGADQGISLEQLVIDNEWLDAYNYILQGIEVNEETIAAELIEEVGITQNFVAEQHTVKHMRNNYWPTRLFNRTAGMPGSDAPTLLEKAHQFVEKATSDYLKMEPAISPAQVTELDYIVKEAYLECGKDS